MKHILEIIDNIKQHAECYVSNIYNFHDLEDDDRILLFEMSNSFVLLIKPDVDYDRLFYAGDENILMNKLRMFDYKCARPLIADIISKFEVNNLFTDTKFEKYQTLIRLIKQGNVSSFSSSSEIVEIAKNEHAEAIKELLISEFDALVDRIPMIEEIEAAITNNKILVVLREDFVCGFLWYETTGKSSIIRYWCVAPTYRDKKIGSYLLTAYLKACSNSIRHILWVKSDNINAIARYNHYGYKTDGTYDLIYCMR